MNEKIIKMYSRPWCSDCHRAKQFLEEHGVAYEEINIDDDPEAEALVAEQNGGRPRTPTFEIEGRYYGDPPLDELGRLLGIS
ncbi:MAG: glutaredoxin family protein [Acidobacteria bacterium]|nr:glutaredoxin family protein [Acidobacteriota bacterium]